MPIMKSMEPEKNRYMDGIRIVGWTCFLLYLGALTYFMFFADNWGRRQLSDVYSYNFVPFREIGRYLRYWRQIGFARVVLNLAGNIVGFMPFGFFVPLLFRFHRDIPFIAGISFCFSAAIEFIQLVSRVGCCDVDDVILNTLGGLLGYALFIVLRDYRRKVKWQREQDQTGQDG